jgi:hypothetical protein
MAISFPPCCSPLPPCEQWLTVVVWGAAVVTIVVGPGVVALALSVGVNTHDPPCEQLLTGVGVGAVLSIVIGGCCSHSSLLWGHRGGRGLFFGGWGVQWDVACLWVCLDTYLAGTPLYRPPSPSREPHIPFEWGGGVVVAMVVTVSFSSPSLSLIVAVPGALIVLWSGLVWPGLRHHSVVVSIHPLHLVSSCLQQQCWVLGRISCPVSIVLVCWAFISTIHLLAGLHLQVTIIIVCPFVVGVGVILSHPIVFVVMAPLPFCHCALFPALLCHLLVSTP